jgi:hypothetical protein
MILVFLAVVTGLVLLEVLVFDVQKDFISLINFPVGIALGLLLVFLYSEWKQR